MSVSRIEKILKEGNYRVQEGVVQRLSFGEWINSVVKDGKVQMRLNGQALEWFSVAEVLLCGLGSGQMVEVPVPKGLPVGTKSFVVTNKVGEAKPTHITVVPNELFNEPVVKRHRLTNIQVAKVKELYAEKKTTYRISKESGVSHTSVLRILGIGKSKSRSKNKE